MQKLPRAEIAHANDVMRNRCLGRAVNGMHISPNPPTCELQGKLFHSFPDMVFRHAEGDHAAVLSFRLGDKEATLPLARIGKEFGVLPGTPDAAMIERIISALDFVPCLRLGDPLPAEVVSGDASWTPDKEFKLLAEARLRMQLIAWLTPESEQVEASGQTLLALAEDPAIRAQAHDAMARAARELGLGSPHDVVALMADLAEELSYLEHLRARFLQRLDLMADKIAIAARSVRAGMGGFETISQVRKLLLVAQRQIQSRFDDLDAQTGEIISALQNLDQQRAFIRAGRDWLYRSYRGFEVHLDRADGLEAGEADLSGFLGPLYHFLAPRFMPATEWLRYQRPDAKNSSRSMAW